MDALAAEMLSYQGSAADSFKANTAKAGGGKVKGKAKDEDDDDGEEPQHGAMGIPFVRIDGSHDSAQ
eukprot:scaffold320691_cov21-Tisochrysis_lutea.AAC.1